MNEAAVCSHRMEDGLPSGQGWGVGGPSTSAALQEGRVGRDGWIGLASAERHKPHDQLVGWALCFEQSKQGDLLGHHTLPSNLLGVFGHNSLRGLGPER